MNFQAVTFPRIIQAVLAAFLIAVAGCATVEPRGPFPPPVQPISDPLVARQWYYGWEKQENLLSTDQPVDIQLFLTMRGRDWRSPDGPDGYAIRVCLLDETDQYVRAKGRLKAFVVHEPARATSRALHAWQVPADEAERRIRGAPVGYILQLDWGDATPPRRGTCMLVVRWESQDGSCRLTKNYVFEDLIPNASVETTTRPAW